MSPQPVSISVIICTHNPLEEYLQRVLDALKIQTLSKEQWELLVIDNASQKPLAGKWDLSWHPSARHICENQLGLTPARLRGIAESIGELLVFVDDDNVISSSYLELTKKLAEKHPNLGCFGSGAIEPEFEQKPQTEYMPFIGYLAIRTVGRSLWGNSLTQAPWGSGLVVRRAVALHYKLVTATNAMRLMLDRKGQDLMSGGDDEFSHIAHALGFGSGIFIELQITHLIAKHRVVGKYFERMLFCNGRSSACLAILHNESPENPFAVPRLANILKMFVGGHILRSIAQTANYLAFFKKNRTERKLLIARYNGWENGIKSFSPPKSNH